MPRLTGREHGVEMDVRLDERRRDQGAAEVDRLPCPLTGHRLGEKLAAHAKVSWRLFSDDARVLEEEIEHAQKVASRDFQARAAGHARNRVMVT